MKKIILFIAYSICLLYVYYVSYTEEYTNHQEQLISDAIKLDNNDFFVKFNEEYNLIYTSTNNYLFMYESLNSNSLGYTFIIRNIKSSLLESEDDYGYHNLVISNEDKEYSHELYSGYYFATPIYMVTISYDILNEEIGDNITNISFNNQDGVNIFSYDINYDLDDKISTDNFSKGYSSNEIKELYTFNTIGNVYKSLLIYHAVVVLILGITVIVTIINKKKQQKSLY